MSDKDHSKSTQQESAETTSRADEMLAKAQSALHEITALGETVKAAAAEVSKAQQTVVSTLSEAQTKMADIASIGTQAVTAGTKITDEQAVIASKSDHIQKAQEHADKVRGDLDRALTAANQQATAAEGLKNRAQTGVNGITELATSIKTLKGTAETEAKAITAAKDAATESTAQIKVLAEKSNTVEVRIAEYEKKLDEFKEQYAAQLQTITDLLPGATTAGLAHDWDKRRQSFLEPGRIWRNVFIVSLVVIVALTAQGLIQSMFADKVLSYDEILRLWLLRAPVVGALVWLALYASRESALAKRLEEDYGYKSAIASTFLGFNKQMSEIGKVAASNEPLSNLCKNTLEIIASPPGRIYEKHNLTVSPTSELTEAVKTVLKDGGAK